MPTAFPGARTGNVLAVDFGGTKTSVATVDASGRIAGKEKSPAASSFEASIEQILPRAGIAAAGVVVPGIYDPRTGSAWAPNLWGREFHPVRAALERRLGVPVAVGSDRTGSVLAEQWLGSARGFEDVVFVAVGTGIGVGIVAGGRPFEGAHGIAGAAGWMPIGAPWKPEYATRGGWEFEAAGPALARRAQMPTAEAVIEAAREGDPQACDAVRQTVEFLGMGVAALIALLDPEIVVLGGGVMQAADLMFEPIRRLALSYTQPVAARKVRIAVTALGEDAGLLGAARLAWLEADRAETTDREPAASCAAPPASDTGE